MKFDLNLGHKFATVYNMWFKQEMILSIRDLVNDDEGG